MPPRDYRLAASPLCQFWCGVLLCVVLLLQAAAAAAAPPSAARKVLVLYSLGPDTSSTWQTLLRKGLSAELDKQDAITHPGIFEERFDAVRVGDDAAIASMEPYLRTKYAGVQFDAIITENYVAARFLSDRPALFPGVPRHYVNHGRPGWKPAGGKSYLVQTDFNLTIGVIPRVAPQVKRVVVIGDSTDRIQESVRAIRKAARAYEGTLVFDYWEHLSFDEMHSQAAQLREGTAIFLLPSYQDRTGERRPPVSTARKLAEVVQVPIFTSWEAIVVPGIAGGYVVSTERIGRAIGRILLQQEPDIAGIPGYLFDYGVVERFHLRDIPSTAHWINRPQSVLVQYIWQIVAGLTLIVLEGILISALIVSLRSRRQTLRALNEERDQLEARVALRTQELMVANTKLEQQATTDPLTGIGNRRRMTEQINKELERSRRFKHPLSLLMADIDHFKEVNDAYGHESGDRVLVMVAHALASGMRSIDMASRFGGEEFVLLMPETDISVARAAAERLRADIAALRLAGDKGEEIHLTISIGVACSAPKGGMDSASSLLSRADKALYRAKHEGRDRVVCS